MPVISNFTAQARIGYWASAFHVADVNGDGARTVFTPAVSKLDNPGVILHADFSDDGIRDLFFADGGSVASLFEVYGEVIHYG